MMTKNETERRDIEALLPWHAAGTLSRRDAQRVEAALKADRDLARRLTPRTVAWSGVVGALAIVLQAGLLANLYINEPGSEVPTAYKTASSATRSLAPVSGSYALISFAPQASAADVTKFLEAHKASIVEGPKGGGLYRIRVSETVLAKKDLAAIVKQMQDDSKIVRFVSATE